MQDRFENSLGLSGDNSSIDYNALKKDVGHIAVTDEAQYRVDRDIYTMHVQHAVQDMRRIKANKIAVKLETATDVAGSDWMAYTGEHSTADPIDQIGTLADTIEANGGQPNTIASHARVFRAFKSNTHINGPPNASPNLTFGNRVATDIPGLPGFTWYIDNLKTNTLATVYDKRATGERSGGAIKFEVRVQHI
jgi:hypothetical protein